MSEAPRINIEIVPASQIKNAGRINFYTQLRREQLGEFLFREAERLKAELAEKNKESKKQ